MDNNRSDPSYDTPRSPFVSPYLERPLRSLEEAQRQRAMRRARQQALREQAMMGGDD